MNPVYRQLLQKSFELHQRGQLREAIRSYDQLLAVAPDTFDALHLKGLATYQIGNPAEAIPLLTKAIRLKSASPPAYNNRGLAYHACGKLELALRDFNKAVELKPDFAEAYCNRATVLRAMGRLEEAEAACLKAIKLNARIAEFHNSLGVILRDKAEWQRARESFATAIALKPNYLEAFNNQGNLLKELRRLDDALACFDGALRLNPSHPQTHNNRATVLQELNRFEEAISSYETAIRLKPDFAFAWVGLADIDSRFGRFKDAEEKYAKARLLDPKAVSPICGIAEVKKFSAEDPVVHQLRELLSDKSLLPEDRARLHHAYGKICNDLGRFDDAIENFRMGKELLKPAFDRVQHRESYAAAKRLFTREFFAERAGFGLSDERPVFIVGMPRSGTTLVEQILASHRLVKGLGELPHLSRLAAGIGKGQRDAQQFVETVRSLTPDDITAMGEIYLQAYGDVDPGFTRVIDKMPHNFQWLGLVALIFPKARIIHCRRNALDTCVSIYMQGYIHQHSYAKDLQTLGECYRDYEDLMGHWRDVLPIQIHDCAYEEVISNLEGSARSLVSFLGLEWDPDCLNYHNQEEQVSTASRWQVRQPLYATSVERWRRYEKHLAPLRIALSDA